MKKKKKRTKKQKSNILIPNHLKENILAETSFSIKNYKQLGSVSQYNFDIFIIWTIQFP